MPTFMSSLKEQLQCFVVLLTTLVIRSPRRNNSYLYSYLLWTIIETC